MLNPITFTVDGESGPVTVTATGLDYAAYEDTFDKPAIAGIAEGRYKTWIYLVWHAMEREKRTELSFDEFLATTPQFEMPRAVEELPPLESTALTGE